LVAAGVLWYFLRPTGHLSLCLSKTIEHYEAIISQHFAIASARTREFAACQGRLSFTIDPTMVRNPKPEQHLEDAIQFGDVVDLKFDFDIEEKPFKFSGSFDIKKIFEWLYTVCGYCDYYLVVSSYEDTTIPISTVPAKAEKSAGTKKLGKLTVRLHPLDRIEKEIPGQRLESFDTLRNSLAFYMFELFSERAVTEDSLKNVVPVKELSHKLPSLKQTVRGFEILKEGYTHSACAGLTSEACVGETRKAFETALHSDPDNAHARLGLGLTLLRQALDAIDSASAYTVGKLLVEAGENLSVAKARSVFLRNLMNSPDWLRLLELPGYRDLNITNRFIDTVRFYRDALNAFSQAEYNQTVDLLAKVEDIPANFSGYIRSLEFEAKLYITETQSEANRLLKEFEQSSQADPADWRWTQSYAFHACRQKVDCEEALRLLDDAIYTAPDLVSYFDSYALKGQCLAILGHHKEAREAVEPVLDYLEKNPDIAEFAGVYLDFGYLFAFLKDYETAADYFIRAATFWEKYLDHVRSAPDLADFRQTGLTAFRRFNRTVLEMYNEKNVTTAP
jgi:tetratricopeptide (TPR) repeat protein